MIAGITSWIFFSLLLGIIGSNRKIGFVGAFFLSLILSPLIGLIFTLASKSLDAEQFEKELLQTQKMQQIVMEKITTQNLNTFTDDLKKIKDLLDREIINKDDYEKIKTSIINKYKDSGSEDAFEKTDNIKLGIDDSYLNQLEKEKVQKMLKYLQNNEVITKHNVNNNIEIMSIKQYDKWTKLYGESVIKVLAKKE